MSKITKISYGQTVSKNYQSQRADVTLELERGDTFISTLKKAKRLVAKALNIPSPEPEKIKTSSSNKVYISK